MKKILFVFATAALFAACSQEPAAPVVQQTTDGDAINFSAFSGTAVTRGTVTTVADFNENGIGVFAFYQPAIGGAAQNFNTYKYAIPDFMFNQQVKPGVTTRVMTAAEVQKYNANITEPGAKHPGDVETAAVNYTDAEAIAYNAALPGSVAEGDVKPDGINRYTDAEAMTYNASLPGAVSTSTIKTPAVLYTEATAASYNETNFVTACVTTSTKVFDYNDVWSYSPVKYWPNNANDQVSFFAYAPYAPSKTWEDMGIKTDVNGKKMVLDFPIYSEVTSQEDYLFASPVLNQQKQDVAATTILKGTQTVNFDFKHITSQVNLFVGVEQDKAAKTPTAWTDAKTSIEVKSILFKNLSTGISYSYDLTASPAKETKSVSTTKQDIELTSVNFVKTAANINTANYTAAEFKQLNTTSDVLFLAPETLGKVYVTYTVTTTDDTNAQNTSVITNTIEADLNGITLVAGSSYKFNFLIGMNSVKVSASITDWVPGSTTQYDVPANTEPAS